MQEGAAWPKVNATVIRGSFEQGISIARPERVTPLPNISSGLYKPAASKADLCRGITVWLVPASNRGWSPAILTQV